MRQVHGEVNTVIEIIDRGIVRPKLGRLVLGKRGVCPSRVVGGTNLTDTLPRAVQWRPARASCRTRGMRNRRAAGKSHGPVARCCSQESLTLFSKQTNRCCFCSINERCGQVICKSCRMHLLFYLFLPDFSSAAVTVMCTLGYLKTKAAESHHCQQTCARQRLHSIVT